MRLVIIGAGGHGQTVADISSQTGKYEEILFLDDSEKQDSLYPVVACCSEYRAYNNVETEMYPAFGNNNARAEWEEKMAKEGINLALIIHPLAYVSPTARIEKGSVIMPYAIVNTNAKIGKACIVNCGSIVDHDTMLEDGCHLAPGAIVKAMNRLPSGTKIDSGKVVKLGEYPINR